MIQTEYRFEFIDFYKVDWNEMHAVYCSYIRTSLYNNMREKICLYYDI